MSKLHITKATMNVDGKSTRDIWLESYPPVHPCLGIKNHPWMVCRNIQCNGKKYCLDDCYCCPALILTAKYDGVTPSAWLKKIKRSTKVLVKLQSETPQCSQADYDMSVDEEESHTLITP